MNQKTKELWAIATVIALATGIPLGRVYVPWVTAQEHRSNRRFLWHGWKPRSVPLPGRVISGYLAAVIAIGLFLRYVVRTSDEADQKDSAKKDVSRPGGSDRKAKPGTRRRD